MEFDAEAAVKMLLDNKDKVPVRFFVKEKYFTSSCTVKNRSNQAESF